MKREGGTIGADRAAGLLTLGHGTATAVELAALIRNAGIVRTVDVRAVPKSRRHPQFRREDLELWVPQLSGSAYLWQPALGGFRKRNPASPNVALRHPAFRAYADYMETEAFEVALNELLALAAADQVAVMCSETVWWRCHRRLISDAAVLLHGVEVRHLMHDGTLRAHLLTPGVRVLAGKLRYDLLFTPEMEDGDPSGAGKTGSIVHAPPANEP
jgi:uncharacterized protein (DUF488 family)